MAAFESKTPKKHRSFRNTKKNREIEHVTRVPPAARPRILAGAETPPAASTLAPAAVKDEANASGHLAAGVPGLVAGLCEAHRRRGTLPLAQVLEPAIHWADNGYPCDWFMAYSIATDLRWLRRYPASAAVFLAGGYMPSPEGGARIVQRDLADTLRRIA